MDENQEKVPVNTYVPKSMKDQIQALSDQIGVSTSTFAFWALQDFLNNQRYERFLPQTVYPVRGE